MSNSSGSKPLPPFLALIALMVATGGIWYLDRPIVTWRPPAPAGGEPPAPVKLSVPARLWEDPLAAVRRREFPKPPASVDAGSTQVQEQEVGSIRNEICKTLGGQGSTRQLRLLPVIIPGSNKDYDIETRLRTRYAVLAALDQQGFSVVEWERLLYFRVSRSELRKQEGTCVPTTKCPPAADSTKIPSPGSDSPVLPVPYEWFEPSNGRTEKVLVLWLDETEFGSATFHKVSRLIDLLTCLGRETVARPNRSRLRVSLIGPNWSSSLVEMLKDLAGPSFRKPAQADMAVFSPWATIEQGRLLAEAAQGDKICSQQTSATVRIWYPGEGRDCASSPAAGDVVIERTILDDARLVRELIYELMARGVDFCSGQSIALISEWDSLYGRVFRDTFCDVLKLVNPCGEKSANVQLLPFVYLMGLDGRLPGDPSEPTTPASAAKDRQAAAEAIERPDGRSQVDYLRRLANRLVENHGKNLRAVGVLGSDVYDKLLVLEALRDRLPHVVFFTTDLDARLLHPSQRRWTHNLVVASSFGLDYLESSTGKGVSCSDGPAENGAAGTHPPFRDSYQTAMHAATLRALAFDAETEKTSHNSLERELGRPKIFEVGRTRLFRLDTEVPEWRSFVFSGVHRALFVLLPTIVLLGIVIIGLQRRAPRFAGRERPFWLKWRWYAVASLAVVLATVELLLYSAQGVREPFAWFEGVSIWPSAVLRVLAAVLAALSLAWLPGRLERVERDLGREFCLNIDTYRSGWRMCWMPVVRSSPLAPGRPKELRVLWRAYLEASAPACRFVRIGIMSFLYLALASLAFLFLDTPHTPFRGAASLMASVIPLWVSILLQVALTFFVVDATCLCRSFVRQVATATNNWPGDAAERLSIPIRLADEALAVRLIAALSKVVGQMILFPFGVILLVIISRNVYFDQWDWPVALLLVYGVNSLIAFSCAFILWWSGEKTRRWALGGLQVKLLREEANKEDNRVPQLKHLVEYVREAHEGAFAPVTQHPLFVALFMPFGGIGVASLLDLLAKSL